MNSIINGVLKTKNKCVDIIIVDYKQCFDSMWLKECANDLVSAGTKDSHLNLLYKTNSQNQVAVKTSFGKTERKSVEIIVLQ